MWGANLIFYNNYAQMESERVHKCFRKLCLDSIKNYLYITIYNLNIIYILKL